jgi:fatty-acyl-CoA synthase
MWIYVLEGILMLNPYQDGLAQRQANYTPLTPCDFIARAAEVYGDRLAMVHDNVRRNWSETYRRTRQLASALQRAGLGYGDTVAALLPNIPAMVEAHFGVPMLGAVLNTLNSRLDAHTLLFMLNHGQAKVLIVDTEYAALAQQAAKELPNLKIITVADIAPADPAAFPNAVDYEAFIAQGDPDFEWKPPHNEWDAIALNYTSGTTGDPKGVVYHHRGAYLNAVSNILEWDLPKHPVYLWTLPLFHCNGWCFAWTVAARAGVNVCLRKFDAKHVFHLINTEGVTHYCGAPIVQSALADAPAQYREGITHTVRTMVAGAPPAPAVIAKMKTIGIELTHVYGLTETYGPASVCAVQDSWKELSEEEQARLAARQGVRYHLQAGLSVRDPVTMEPVPRDGQTLGELMFQGNICMKGYLKNEHATEDAFRGGWFHTGDLGVMMPDGYVRITDRSKDIIISGGENISSIEVEDALYRHPAVALAAVVAVPDPKWGEIPCAVIQLREGATATEEDIIEHCRQLLARYKVPRLIKFAELPRTATGKIQKHQLRAQFGSKSAIDFGNAPSSNTQPARVSVE